MNIIDCKQGDGTWMGLRCGRPTASRADCIITSAGAATKGAKRDGYLHELTAEAVTKTVEMHFVTAAMERGTTLEPEARNWYALVKGVEVQQGGFAASDCGRWGCSPDGLAGSDGGLEAMIVTDSEGWIQQNNQAGSAVRGVGQTTVPRIAETEGREMIVEIVLFAMLSLALYAAGWRGKGRSINRAGDMIRAAITAATEGN